MATEEQVRESLQEVLVPGAMRSLVKLNLVRRVTISNKKVKIGLASAALDIEAQDWIKSKVRDVIRKLPGVKVAQVDFLEGKPSELNQVRQIVAVMSGKGGVGKVAGCRSYWTFPGTPRP